MRVSRGGSEGEFREFKLSEFGSSHGNLLETTAATEMALANWVGRTRSLLAMTTTRTECLRAFLDMFGPLQLDITSESPEEVRARVRWPDDPDWQDIRWPVSEAAVPSHETLEIARYISSHGLLDIDQITVPRDELYARMRSDIGIPWSRAEFDRFLEQLLSIEVPWIDSGGHIDAFFVHE